jgi:uncharacterized membrane protein
MNDTSILFEIMGFLLWPIIIILLIVFIIRALFGRHGGFNKRLSHELPAWEAKGIINRQQGDEILALYKLKRADARPRMDMVKILSMIGALFVGIGVIFFVASNWQKITPMAKTALLLGISIVTLYAGYFFHTEKKGFENLGKSLLLLACLFWGGSIALISQIYNLPVSDTWFIMWLWALPILPVAVIFSNVYVYTLCSVLFLIWNFLYKSTTHSPNYLYPLIVFGILLPFGSESKVVRRINILGLIVAAIVCCFMQFEWVALLISVGLLGYGYFRKEEPFYLRAAAISLLCWAITFFIVRNNFPNVFFILPFWMILRLSREHDDMANVGLTLFCGLVWFDLIFYSYSRIYSFDYGYTGFLLLQIAVGLLIYLTGIVLKLRNLSSFFVYKAIGYIVGLVFVYLAAFEWTARCFSEGMGAPLQVILYCMLSLVLLGALYAGKAGYFREKAHRYELAGMALLAAAVISFLFFPQDTVLLLFIVNGVLFALALINLFMGLETQRPGLFNAGVLIFVLLIITRFVDIGWKLKEKSLFFIVGGLLLMGLGIFSENKRRKIIERMRG